MKTNTELKQKIEQAVKVLEKEHKKIIERLDIERVDTPLFYCSSWEDLEQVIGEMDDLLVVLKYLEVLETCHKDIVSEVIQDKINKRDLQEKNRY
tara:strand:+ start:306 stop:590 length:285 start_codon:yes stop_codon:yes gene_type:complete